MHKPDVRHLTDPFSTDVHGVQARSDDASGQTNDIAASYQPRRQWFAIASIAMNLAGAAALVVSGAADAAHAGMARLGLASYWITPIYLILLFVAHAAVNFPLELWAGYVEERQFGLAKNGIRAWSLDWLLGVSQHGILFVAGSCLLIVIQSLMPHAWLIASAAMLLLVFLLTCYFAVDLLPNGLFQIEAADEPTVRRLQALTGDSIRRLPSIYIYSTAIQRDFAGGLLGLANRQVLLISRSTIELASDTLLRFVLLHEMGHRRQRHVLLSTLIGWTWIVAGVAICNRIAPPETRATPVFIAWLALTLTTWLAITEPLMAFVGRRMEYAADRHFMRHGGTLDELRAALTELSRRNLAQTDRLSRRRTALHPLPSVPARLHRARQMGQKTGVK